MMDSLVIIVLAAFALLAAKHPVFALWVATASIPLYIVRLQLWNIPTNLWELIVVLLAVCVLVPRLGELSRSLRPTLWGWMAAGLLLVGLALGFFMAPDGREALGIIKGWFIIPALYAASLYQVSKPQTVKQIGDSVYQVANRRITKYVPRALLLSSLPISATALWQVITNNFITIDGRASAWFLSANYLALFLVPVLLLSISSLLQTRGKVRIAGWIVWAMGLAAVYFSFSFGGWFALASGVVVYLIILRGVRAKPVWMGLLGLAALGGLAYLTIPRFAALFDLVQRTSASVRLQVWSTALLMIKDRWLTGLGLGSFDQNYLSYAVRLFPSPLETMMLHPHNFFFQIAISLGLPGLIGFGLIVIQWWRQLFRLADRYLVASLAAAMTGILLHGLIDTTYFKNDLAAIFWLLIGLAYVQTKSTDKTS